MLLRSKEWLVLGLGLSLHVILYGARILTSGRLNFGFLLWNLTLALVPLGLAMCLKCQRRHVGFYALFGLWFIFLPNAPYIITDLVHIRQRPPIPVYYDALLLGNAALTGLFAGAFSVHRVHHALCGRWSRDRATMAIGVAIFASGFGIYLGRFERWNSWDLLVRPLEVLRSIAEAPAIRVAAVTVAAAGLLAMAVLAVSPPPLEGADGSLRRARLRPRSHEREGR
ncbi:MAG: DUF1361 domain-containing protein [Myxococcota bacterium]